MQRLPGVDWGRAVRIAAPLGALIVEGWPALIGALLIQEGGLWFAGRLVDADRRTFARQLFLAAFGLRVLIALPTHYLAKLSNGNGALFQDDYTYDLVGEWLVRIARGDGGISVFPGHQHLLDDIYPYFLGGLYTIFGYSPLLPKLVNSALAALCAVLVFEIARRIFRPPAAVIAALGAALLPSLIVWSIASLKETLVLFTSLLALWILQYLTTAAWRSPRLADAAVALIAMLTLLLDLRATTTAIMIGLVVMIYIARSNLRPRSWQIVVVGFVLVGVIGGGVWFTRVRSSDRPLTTLFEDVALQIRHRRAQEAADARSQIRPETDVVSANGRGIPAAEAASDAAPFDLVGDVIDPLGYALFAPAPWQASSLTELGASIEMPVWYVLLISSFFAWRAEPRQRLFVVCLAVYGVTNWLVLAASEGNLGNLLRHRLMLDPTLLILGGAGAEWLWVRAGRPLSTRVPARLVPARGDS